MSIVAGIDLGTTNCCIAIPADTDIPNKQALIDSRRLRPLGGALLVANPDLSLTTPSAVWIGPDGTPLVGALAKRKARQAGAPPAMFFKRNMGTDQPVIAGHATLTPLQASVHLLRHLKTVAEQALGVAVDRAVITVPAYFETSAKTQTTQAGAEAGLEVAETLMEPVAAALAHMHESGGTAAERKRFLVYDLGGGTFDTSVVSWDPEDGFSSRSFDGDRYLGGYDFDQAIVDWMITQLPAYDLRAEPGDAADAERLARLLSLAETAKHDLTRETETEIINQDLEDRTGLPMSINLPLGRHEFNRLIEGFVNETLDHCAEALSKARLTQTDLDEIVLVGGSSRVPLVAELLEARFGLTPRLFHPELVVAVGAALKAANLATRSQVLELEALVPDGDSVDIAGRVLLSNIEAAEIEVEVAPEGWEPQRERITDPEGTFLFIEVPLGDGECVVRVLADGREIAVERVGVRAETATAVPDLAGDILAHDFSVELLDRQLCRVVQAGTKIPHRVYQRLETAIRGTTLAVRLYEGWIPIGVVKIRDLPEDLEPGAVVELTLEFAVGWTVHASVRIPHLDRSATAVIEIPVREVASWDEIRTRAAAARTDWRQMQREAHRAESAKARPEIEQRLDALEPLVARTQDQAKAHHLLLEAETILQGLLNSRGPEDYLEPPLADFEESLRNLSELVLFLQREEPDSAPMYRLRRDDLEQQGRAAYDAGDFVAWPRVNEKLDDLEREILHIPSIREIAVMQQTPSLLRDWLKRRIDAADNAIRRKYGELQTDSRVDQHDRVKLPAQRDDLLADLSAISFAVEEVDAARPSAPEQLRNIYYDRLRPLEHRINGWGREAGMRQSQ
ncbi:Hsp70 family protein [Nocardia sp. ET3-3]|uniref:Hsp70 family protein n=1 Tax=Nocardia terrae TaxID=2675851 RepID=A0A7K1V6I4_9NOCA|nr:Hsp70 family protein [Nocardia terrae]MVU82250.1 Hsp70 family protein [Nocardia terrae]